MNSPSPFIREYGQPGGIWLAYTLSIDCDRYAVYNEGGELVYSSPSEQDCIDYCEASAC